MCELLPGDLKKSRNENVSNQQPSVEELSSSGYLFYHILRTTIIIKQPRNTNLNNRHITMSTNNPQKSNPINTGIRDTMSSPHASPMTNPPTEKIFDILLYLSVRDPISFHLIHPRHLHTPSDWIRFVNYATTSPTRDGIGLTVKRAIIRHLATRALQEITPQEATLLIEIARPYPTEIRNLQPLFE